MHTCLSVTLSRRWICWCSAISHANPPSSARSGWPNLPRPPSGKRRTDRLAAIRLDDDEKGTISITDSAGGRSNTIISEAGLYLDDDEKTTLINDEGQAGRGAQP